MVLFRPVFSALKSQGVRYVAVGGLAVVLHGFARLTADIDLILDLEPDNARRAIEGLVAAGLVPRPPVDAYDFCDERIRRTWIEEKGMRVFSLWAPMNPMLEVDLFVESPVPFPDLWDRSVLVEAGDISIRIASIKDLIALKRVAGRALDLEDIAALTSIAHTRGEDV
jgi:hypothetical protein